MNLKFLFLLGFLFFNFAVFANSNGKSIFERYCTACHSPSMAPMFSSPAAHDLDAWQIRKNDAFKRAIEKNPSVKASNAEQKEGFIFEELILSAVTGTDNGMPPKGTCNDCSEDDLKSAIKYMSSELK